MSMLQQLDKWHKTRIGHLAFAIVELAAAYGFASWAIDSGNLLDYLFTFLFLVGGIQNLIKLTIKVVRHGSK
jgi:hypothetical protein